MDRKMVKIIRGLLLVSSIAWGTFSYALDNTNNISDESAMGLFSDGGKIVGIGPGPNNKKNEISTLAVSDNNTQDDVPLTIKVTKARNVRKIHLEFSVNDLEIAEIQTLSCDIRSIKPDGSGECEPVNVTPKKPGTTKIYFNPKRSYWVSKDFGIKHYYSNRIPIGLKPIKIYVGTLYAGYVNGKVYRKGSETTLGTSVRGLALNQDNHTLYAIANSTTVYKQANESELSFTPLATLPDAGGIPQTLVLDRYGRLFIGTGYGTIYKVIDQYWSSSYSVSAKLPDSINDTVLDTTTNTVYFVDRYTNLSIGNLRLLRDTWTNESEVLPKNYQNMNIVINNGELYASAFYKDSLDTVGSDLFTWINNNMVKIQLSDKYPNPFTGGVRINKLIPYDSNLYAGGSDNNLYQLNFASASPYWEKISDVTLPAPIIDYAVDNNENIYLATNKGIWKIPFNNRKEAYLLSGYGSGLSTVIVDNNL